MQRGPQADVRVPPGRLTRLEAAENAGNADRCVVARAIVGLHEGQAAEPPRTGAAAARAGS